MPRAPPSRPARAIASGNTLASPRPTSTKPPRATAREPVVTAATAPAAASNAPPTSNCRSPRASSSRPPASRPQAMAREKPAYPAAATMAGAPSCSRSSRAPQSVSAPSPNAVHPAIAPSTTRTAVGRRVAPPGARFGSEASVPRPAPTRAGSAHAVANNPAAATSVRCAPPPSAEEAAPPGGAPPSPPKLKPACSPDRIGRPTAASTCTPTELAATLTMPVAAPKTKSATQSAGTEYTSPGRTAAADTRSAATALTGPAPNRAHQAPVKRMQKRAPRDRQSSATPSVLWPAPTRAATSGTRAAQLPKTAPSRTKSTVTAARRRPTDGGGTRPTARTRPSTGLRARRREGDGDTGVPHGGNRPPASDGGGHEGQGEHTSSGTRGYNGVRASCFPPSHTPGRRRETRHGGPSRG